MLSLEVWETEIMDITVAVTDVFESAYSVVGAQRLQGCPIGWLCRKDFNLFAGLVNRSRERLKQETVFLTISLY